MKCNMGAADRAVRIILGLALVVWGLGTRNWWGAIGVVLLFTAAVRWCPLYLPFRISTAGRTQEKPRA